MNRITNCAALISGYFLFTGIASADPLVQFPEGNAAWTVDITYPKSSAAPTPEPRDGANTAAPRKVKRVEIAQFADQKKLRITWTDDSTTEQWTIPNLPVVFKEYPNGVVFPVGTGSMEHKYGESSMPANASAFGWVTPACLKEKDPVKYQAQLCYHYVGTANLPATPRGHSLEDVGPEAVKREAWIDSKTLLPVGLDTETSHCIFTFHQPPTGPLDMPLKFKQGIANYKHIMGFP